jgi:hypothetical protein
VSHYHGEPPDHVVPVHNSINDIFGFHSIRNTPSPPIKKAPKIIISNSHLCQKNFIKPSVAVTLHHGGLALIHWNPTQAIVNSVVFAVVFKTVCIFADQTINQWNKFDYIGVSYHEIGFLKKGNKVVVMIILIPHLSSKRRHDTNESTSLGCHLIGRKLHHPDTTSKQWTQQKIWIHLKQLLFYSWDTGDLIRPAEEWGEEAKNIVGCNLCDISTSIHPFQTIISALERYIISVDAIQVFEHHNLTGIGEDTASIVNINGEPFQHFILFVVTI